LASPMVVDRNLWVHNSLYSLVWATMAFKGRGSEISGRTEEALGRAAKLVKKKSGRTKNTEIGTCIEEEKNESSHPNKGK